MLIFINEDSAYRYWVTHHRHGFVLDGRFKPKWCNLELHRAECPHVRQEKSRRWHWTTGSRFKACALHRDELIGWVEECLGLHCARCVECSPDTDRSNDAPEHHRLTRLSAAILEYVLEAAVIHFDDETPPYHVTVEMIAGYLGKSPGQVSPALYRLVDDGFLLCDRYVCAGKPFRARAVVYPTQRALRTLPEYSNDADEMIAAELAKLGSTPNRSRDVVHGKAG